MKVSVLLSLAATALVSAAPVTNDGTEDLTARDGYGNYGKYEAYAPYTTYKRDVAEEKRRVATEEEKRSGYGNYGNYDAAAEEDKRNGYGNYGKYGTYAPYTSYKRDPAPEAEQKSEVAAEYAKRELASEQV
ncbi:hypothetical protein BKA67DRAFT_350222 [Truncatella angustata]|uniref:Uncharacterized protein n=1 Tax=Truncatella angustata TaxID=152316 RepID=A0A9P8UHC2_9PEZI|nr:uncharacterized protein BKA67DRAFT_350222 [Truncatella angustata]KAH6652196.1 hypothetical protein BKA67DRAFT_350222 [Truncatella angustata]